MSWTASIKEFLKPKSFSLFGYAVVVLYVITGTFLERKLAGFTNKEREEFCCESHNSVKDQHFLQMKCFDQYDQLYNSPPLYGFVLLTFFVLLIVCIVYSCCVKSRVDQVEEACTFNTKHGRPTPRTKSYLVFWSYLVHLLVRCGFGFFFAFVQLQGLQPSIFPYEFHCRWHFPVPKRTIFANAVANANHL